MKTLKQIMGDLGGYMPKPEAEQNFVKKHVVDKKEDMNGNGDDVFNAAKVKVADRPGERHGYTNEDDDKVNEAVEPEKVTDAEAKQSKWAQVLRKYKVIGKDKPVAEEADLEEKKLTPAELKKREEIAQAMERENPGMDMGKKMAIATAQAKKVAEEAESVEEAKDTVSTDASGKVTSWSHEGDWEKKGSKKNPEGKVHNLAGQALKKTKEMTKEEVELEEAKEEKKPAKGKGVTPTGVYDSVPLGITVANEEVQEDDINTSLLEMFVALDEEEQQMFIEMLETNGELLGEIAQEAK